LRLERGKSKAWCDLGKIKLLARKKIQCEPSQLTVPKIFWEFNWIWMNLLGWFSANQNNQPKNS
jgi:hypothetical protein